MRENLVGRNVGASVKRLEDRRLLTGRGHYVADVTVPGMAHAAFLRSPHPHALLGAIDTSAARAVRGVYGVLTGADITSLTNPLMGMLSLEGLYDPWFWALAVDRVRHVGDPVAIVVAESRALAEDACELIEVDYRPLDPIAGEQDALDPSKPPIWPVGRGNVVYDHTDTHGDVDAAFAHADRVVRETFHIHRQGNQPMETRGMVAEVDADGRLTLHASHQAAHLLKWGMAFALARRPAVAVARDVWRGRGRIASVARSTSAFLKANPGLVAAQRASLPIMAKANLRDPGRARWLMRGILGLLAQDPGSVPEVTISDVGGAFGSKTTVLREEVALCAAARHLRRSISWIEDRNENLTTGAQAREESVTIEAAVTRDGTILGMRTALIMDQGAYPAFPFGAPFFARLLATVFPGPYRLPALEFRSRIVASNKASYVAYRGPWASETWTRERMLDVIAVELGLSAAEIRLRNMIGRDELPATMITGPALDVRMSARTTLERALEIADIDGWAQAKAAARAEGRHLGLGIATYIEAAPGPPGFMDVVAPGFGAMLGAEPGTAVLERDGTVTLRTQQVPHGQGQETTMAQIAADELGVPVESIQLVYGDSRTAPFGVVGTGGSRSAAMQGGAIHLSTRALRTAVAEVAAGLLEADPADVEVTGGIAHVRGVPGAGRSMAEIAAEAIRLGVGTREDTRTVGDEAIRTSRGWDGGEGGWAQATHLCWVEVDLETGFVTIPRYVVVEDCGEIINPAIVEGQIRGGVAQGVGAVLYEKVAYDADAQLVSGTYLDYLVPTVSEIPAIEIHHVQTPSDIPFNYRGVGEGGMIGAPAAITNAIADALSETGARITEQHLPPSRILELAGIVTAARAS